MDFTVLTKQERLQMMDDIDYILAFMGISIAKEAVPKPPQVSLIEIEGKINKVLALAWKAKTEDAYKKAVTLLEQYGRDLDRTKARMIADGLNVTMSTDLMEAMSSTRLVDHIYYTYDMAGNRTAKKLKVPYVFTIVDQKAKDWLVKDTVYWIGNFYNSFVRDAVTQTVIQYAIEEGQNYWTTGQRIKEVLGGTYEIPPKYLPGSYIRAESYWQLLASNATTRANIFGQIEPMLAADVTEYEILAAHDERMCPLCGKMDGKRFSIEHAVKLRDDMMNAKTPEDVKTVHPWHTVKDIKSWAPEELAGQGMALPPFHGSCRCDIVVSSFVEKHLPGKHDQKTHGRKNGGRLLQEIHGKGGFTYQPHTGNAPKEGFALSISPKYEEVVSETEFTRKHIDDYLIKHKDVLADPSNYLGGWHDVEAGKVYLDITCVAKDNKEAEALCIKYNQEGYFDLKKGETVIVKKPGERRT